jgi:hypothetical protein
MPLIRARRVLKRCYAGRPGARREIEFVLQVLEVCLAPVQLGEKHREFVHWRKALQLHGLRPRQSDKAIWCLFRVGPSSIGLSLRQVSAWRGLSTLLRTLKPSLVGLIGGPTTAIGLFAYLEALRDRYSAVQSAGRRKGSVDYYAGRRCHHFRPR